MIKLTKEQLNTLYWCADDFLYDKIAIVEDPIEDIIVILIYEFKLVATLKWNEGIWVSVHKAVK